MKVGKTRVCMELARQLWFGEPWPDGQDATLPERTRTLWVPGDRHQDELRDLAAAYGLPPEAVLLNADPSEPYSGWSLDEPDDVDALARRIEAERPGVVFIDTVWKATRRRLGRENEVSEFMDPLVTIAQRCEVALVGLMHLSRDGETLGRRLEGIARAVLKLSRPDPDGQPDRRKLWVDRANFQEPPPLGCTIGDGGVTFDHDPPSDAKPNPPGRPAESRDRAKAFIRDRLGAENDRIGNELCREWEAQGGSSKTFWRAVDDLAEGAELVKDGGKGTGKQVVLHLIEPA